MAMIEKSAVGMEARELLAASKHFENKYEQNIAETNGSVVASPQEIVSMPLCMGTPRKDATSAQIDFWSCRNRDRELNSSWSCMLSATTWSRLSILATRLVRRWR